MEQTDNSTERLHSIYADVEAKIAVLSADKRVVFYVNARHGSHSAVFGGRAGIAVSTIREAPSVRDFILGVLLADYSFNGRGHDGDRLAEDEIDSIFIEEHY